MLAAGVSTHALVCLIEGDPLLVCGDSFGPLDDDPKKVEDAIRKTYELNSVEKNTDAYRRGYARNMTEQGEALLRYGEIDEAEKLANLAGKQPVSYGPFESKPQDLLSKIAAARRSNGAGQHRTRYELRSILIRGRAAQRLR